MDWSKRDANQPPHRARNRAVEPAHLMVAPLSQCDVAPLCRIRTIVEYVLGESIVRANLQRVERTRPSISKPNPCAQPRLLRVS